MVGLDDLRKQPDDGARRVEFAPTLPFAHRELAEKIFVDAPESVVVEAGGNLRHLLQKLLQKRGGEAIVRFRKNTRELRIVLLDLAHSGVDLGADVLGLGQTEQIVVARLGRQVNDAFGLVRVRFVQRGATAQRYVGLFQHAALGRKTELGEAQKNEAEYGRRVLLGLEARVGAELIRSVPEIFLKRCGRRVFLLRGDPLHSLYDSNLVHSVFNTILSLLYQNGIEKSHRQWRKAGSVFKVSIIKSTARSRATSRGGSCRRGHAGGKVAKLSSESVSP